MQGRGCAAIFALVMMTSGLAHADDDTKKDTEVSAPAPKILREVRVEPGLTERERMLLDRVEQLEKRVAELETKGGKSAEAAAPAVAITIPATARVQ